MACFVDCSFSVRSSYKTDARLIPRVQNAPECEFKIKIPVYLTRRGGLWRHVWLSSRQRTTCCCSGVSAPLKRCTERLSFSVQLGRAGKREEIEFGEREREGSRGERRGAQG